MTPEERNNFIKKIGFLTVFSVGATMGFWGIIISNISDKIIKTPLGFAPLSLKNIIRTSTLTGSIYLCWGIFGAWVMSVEQK